MSQPLRHLLILSAKDLRLELRGLQTTGLIVVLGVLIIVVLGMGLGGGRPVAGIEATAILWVAYLFGGVMCFDRTMAVERQDDALAALLAAPIDRGVIFASKLITNLILITALAAVITPIGVLLFRFDLSAHPLGFVAVMALGVVGYAAIGTLFAAAVSSSSLQGGLLAVLIFPLSLPVIITSTQTMRTLFGPAGSLNESGIAILIAFDLVFLALSWLAFELVLEP